MDELKLTNFRSFLEKKIIIWPQTVLIGPNGSGKTNILEAVFFLATTSSFRAKRDADMINEHQNFFRVEYNEIAAAIFKNNHIQKTFWVKGKKTPVTKIPGLIPVVLFSPDLLHLIGGAPAERRKMLNVYLSQSNPLYSSFLVEYQATLKQRNALLCLIKEGKSDPSELEFWNQRLIEDGYQIIKARREFILEANRILKLYQTTVWNRELFLNYKSAISSKEEFRSLIQLNLDKEVRYSQTLVGPHREDLDFVFNKRSLATFGSRGEWRISLLMYLFAAAAVLSKEAEPIFLLDDVFSELDKNSRLTLQEALKEKKTIITATDKEELSVDILPEAKLINL